MRLWAASMLCLLGNSLVAQENAWAAPILDKDNEVLADIRSYPLFADPRVNVLLWRPPEGIEKAVLDLDTAEVLDGVAEADGVALSYAPPFVVYFVGSDEKDGTERALVELGGDRNGQSIVFATVDYRDPEVNHATINAFWRNHFLAVFPRASGAEHVPECIARQIIATVYTGGPESEVEYQSCLEGFQ